nr:MAG TPA: hypothetical protein [Caudoviricetes sp.]
MVWWGIFSLSTGEKTRHNRAEVPGLPSPRMRGKDSQFSVRRKQTNGSFPLK